MPLSVFALKGDKKDKEFSLFEEIQNIAEKNQFSFENGDVLVISSKYISNSQGRTLDSEMIRPSDIAKNISSKYNLTPSFAEVIIRESDVIFGGVSGFAITSADNIIAPNAGIDRSNTLKEKLILYPTEPYRIAEELRRKFFLKFGIHIGVIITDSRLMPARVGTTGIAIACAGIEPVTDVRGKKDLDGNPLKVTFQAVADNLASIANHKMGEASESTPVAVLRDSGAQLTDRRIMPNEMAISHDLCVYMRGLKMQN